MSVPQQNTTKVFLLTGLGSCHQVLCKLVKKDGYLAFPPVDEEGKEINGVNRATVLSAYLALKSILQNTESKGHEIITTVWQCTNSGVPAGSITGTSAGLALVLAMAANWSGLNGRWNQIAATGILVEDQERGHTVCLVDQIQEKLEIAVQCLDEQGAILYPEANYKIVKTQSWFHKVKDDAAKKNIALIAVSLVEQAVQECFEISSQPGPQQLLSQPGMGCKRQRLEKKHSWRGLTTVLLLTAGLVAAAWLLRPATTPQSPAEQHEEKTSISGESMISAASREALVVRPEDPLQHPGYTPCD